MRRRLLTWAAYSGFLLTFTQPLFAVAEEERAYDPETGAPVPVPMRKDDESGAKSRREEFKRSAKKVRYHLDGLKDVDPEVRRTSAEMLGYISSPDSIPSLINALGDRHVSVQLAAHGALVRITGKNFGYKQQHEWLSWWRQNQKEFEKNFFNRPTETAQLRATASNTIGLELMRQHQWRAAQAKFLDAVNFDPEVPDYRNNLGNALRGEGRYLDAMEYYEETIGLDSQLPQPYYNIGLCYQLLGRDIEAQHWFHKAVEKDKNGSLWEHLHLLGRNLLGQKDFESAKEFLEQACMRAERQRVRNPTIHKDLALAYYGLHRLRDAWRELQYIHSMGYEPAEGLVAKVRAELIASGTDPDNLVRPEETVLPAVDEPSGGDFGSYSGPFIPRAR
jgi:tetratricopeptide (TPR) repeat protein